MSGLSASTICSSNASSASTTSATLLALARTRPPSARACANEMFRGLGGKNTKPTISAPASSATSSVPGVERPQILTTGDMTILLGLGSTSPKRICLARRIVADGRTAAVSLRGHRALLRAQCAGELARLHRLAEQRALHQVETRVAHCGEVSARIDACRDGAYAEPPAKVEHGRTGRPLEPVAGTAVDEGPVDLDFHEREAVERRH